MPKIVVGCTQHRSIPHGLALVDWNCSMSGTLMIKQQWIVQMVRRYIQTNCFHCQGSAQICRQPQFSLLSLFTETHSLKRHTYEQGALILKSHFRETSRQHSLAAARVQVADLSLLVLGADTVWHKISSSPIPHTSLKQTLPSCSFNSD